MTIDLVPKLKKISIEYVDFKTSKVLAMEETTGSGESVTYFPAYLDFKLETDALMKQGTAAIYSSENKTHRVLHSTGRTYGQEFDLNLQTDVFEKTETGYRLKRTRFTQDQRYGSRKNPRYFECTYDLVREP